MPLLRLKHKILSLSLIFSCIGCGVTKGYSGPQLPPDQVSQIFFRDSHPLSIEQKEIDSVPEGVFDDGIDVLPGRHLATFSAIFKEREECGSVRCHRVVERDKDGNIKKERCDCEQSCSEEIYRTYCRVFLSSAAGERYAITLRAGYRVYEADIPSAVALTQGTEVVVGRNECTPFRYDRTHYFEKNPSRNYCW